MNDLASHIRDPQPCGLCCVLWLGALLIAVMGGPAWAQDTAAPANVAPSRPAVAPERLAWERYRVIEQQNMFLKPADRPGIPRQAPSDPPPDTQDAAAEESEAEATATAAAPAPGPGSDWLLTGTLITPERRIALLENVKTGERLHVHQGASSPAGFISRIHGRSVTIGQDSEVVTVNIGQRLDGSSGSGVTPPATGGETSTANAAGSSEPSSPSNSSPGASAPSSAEQAILERLRARRNQEIR